MKTLNYLAAFILSISVAFGQDHLVVEGAITVGAAVAPFTDGSIQYSM